jgi:hypothetical protein
LLLTNWYPRETSLLFTGRQMLCSMSVRKCIRFCIPELQSWPEVKNTNMKFMKTQDKNIQISVYCIQHNIFIQQYFKDGIFRYGLVWNAEKISTSKHVSTAYL